MPFVLIAGHAGAQTTAFSWDGEVEMGVESVIDSDAVGNEIDDAYFNLELSGTLDIGARTRFFATLAGESVLDPVDDRAFEDIGFFIKELGVSFDLTENATVSLGKITPVFGRTWDEAAGFFGGTLGEDYELTEQIGVTADVVLTNGGVLSLGVFYVDDTGLSRSAGTDRGRNRASDGGAGNTGELDNVAVTWTQEFGDSSVQLGVRHLSAGQGDASDETGVVASFGHSLSDDLAAFAEVAHFDGFGGGTDDALYLTLNGAYQMGPWVFSGTYAHRDLDTAGDTDLFTVAAEYEFSNGVVAGGGIAFVDDDGTSDTVLGLNVVIPLGG